MQGNFPGSILEATAWQMDKPELFSGFHLAAFFITVIASVILAKKASGHYRDEYLIYSGWILAVLEVYKQLFIYFVINDGVYNWWFFPFQLCSVPMYLCVLLPLVQGSIRESFLTFMSSYTLISAAAALIYPEDFLRPYITLTAHGFIWHGILLFISLLLLFSNVPDRSIRGFVRATGLFIVLSAVAVLINALVDTYMFYLNPYHNSPQPLVGTVQNALGIPAGLILYILAIIIAAGLTLIIKPSGKKAG
ncbi:MAG: YwaF family protein [Mogibacterium sp.]|nr:YwaF family protein [Mogibacterium sp.]